jgi:uncharacterized membrane protein
MLAGWIFTSAARLTGITETTSASVFVTGDIDISVLSLAALLIALIGILNDITVAQASVVFSLLGHGNGHDHGHDHGSGPSADEVPMTRRERRLRGKLKSTSERSLLRRSMAVGQDHAASAIYTVSFSVVGASLAAFVAAKSYGMPVWALLQSEDVAHTIVQLLAGIVGLTVTMPATTLFAIGLARLLLGEAQAESAPTNSRSAGSSRRD